MNLHEKLLEIRKSCAYLKRDNDGYQFSYVSSSQTLGTLRGKMDELGVLLIPSVTSFEVRDHTTSKGGHEYFTIISMIFMWVDAENPEDKIPCLWTGQGLDSGEKGVGKALTYAEKYFMLKFFNIATDKDDPDSFQRKNEKKQQPKKPPEKKKGPPKTNPYDNYLKGCAEIKAKIIKLDGTDAAYRAGLVNFGLGKANELKGEGSLAKVGGPMCKALRDYIGIREKEIAEAA